jgi:hypothetical protein
MCDDQATDAVDRAAHAQRLGVPVEGKAEPIPVYRVTACIS